MHSPSHPAIPGGGPELRALLVAEAAGAVAVAPGGERGDAGGHEEQLLRGSRRGPAGRAQLEAAPRRQRRRHLEPPRSRLGRAGHDGKGRERAPPGGREDGGRWGWGAPWRTGGQGARERGREERGRLGAAGWGECLGRGIWDGGVGRGLRGGKNAEKVWGGATGRGEEEELQREWIWGEGKGDLVKGFEEGK